MEHLAIFEKGEFLERILNEKKTVESRFSLSRTSLFGKVKVGDRIFIKESGGDVLGEFKVARVASFTSLDPKGLKDVLTQYKKELGLTDLNYFFELKKDSKYATLIWVSDLVKYSKPFSISKNDRQSWVILNEEVKKKYNFPEF